MLDYKLSKAYLHSKWRHAAKVGVFEDAFHDTWADYLELHATIPSTLNHRAWLQVRMWNNVNMYPPFCEQVKAKNGGYKPTYLYSLDDTDELLDGNDPEGLLIREQDIEQHLREQYPEREGEHPCMEWLRKGHKIVQVQDIQGCSSTWIKRQIKKAREQEENNE